MEGDQEGYYSVCVMNCCETITAISRNLLVQMKTDIDIRAYTHAIEPARTMLPKTKVCSQETGKWAAVKLKGGWS